MAPNKIFEIGSVQKFTFNNLVFDVKILDMRKRRAREYLIEPVAGSGQDWMQTFTKKYKPIKKQ